MSKQKATDIVTNIVDMLTPHNSDERKRIIQAALTLMGDTPIESSSATTERDKFENDTPSDMPAKGKMWLRQNEISAEMLDQVFHVNGGEIELIASEIPGKSDKEKTLNVYVLAGVAQLLVSGNPAFEDKYARKLCADAGCYDATNHAARLKLKGRELSGSKDKGWVLTTPGLKKGAVLVKEMSQ